jgi:tetratricopeptide (TPR) repeat protein
MNAVLTVLDAVDEQGEVTRVASEAQIALQEGDTSRARALFRQAAEMMEPAVGGLKKASERDLARFLVATHYYLGGHYDRAARVCKTIQQKRLPSNVRHLYPPFLKDVSERSAPDYVARYRHQIESAYQRALEGDRDAAQQVIEIFMEHSYLVPRDQMAYMRARSCEILGRQRAASLFYREAWRFHPENPIYVLFGLRSLCKEGKYSEAWAIVQEELDNRPGVRSSIYAIFVRHRQIGAVSDLRDRQAFMADIIEHLELAWESYSSHAAQEQKRLTRQMDWAFTMAWNDQGVLKDAEGQRKLLDRWIERRPDSPYPRILRGAANYPGERSIEDFREAIRLGSTEPWPYYFLAEEALRSLGFRECDRLCSQALQRNLPTDIRAALLSWQAISRWNLDPSRPQQIRKLFEEARRLKPDDSLIASYAQTFNDGEIAPSLPASIRVEGEKRMQEQARQYVDELSRRGIEESSSTLNPIAV